MSTLHRAVIRAYTAGTHKADVQLVESVPTHVVSVPVATDIPPAYVVAGRECAVLFFDDNPDNAVLVTVHGAVPGALGDTTFDDQIAVGPGMAIASGITGYFSAGQGSGIDSKVGLAVDMGGQSAAPTNAVVGIAGRALSRDAATLNVYGLDYIAGGSGQTFTAAYGCRTALFMSGAGKTLTDYFGYHANMGGVLSGTVTNFTGYYVPSMSLGTNRRPFFENGRSGTITDADGNRFRSNSQFGSTTGSFGGGDGVIGIANATTAPNANPTGGGVLYASAGALVWRGSGGTVTTIAPA